jgi:hypothetical protein
MRIDRNWLAVGLALALGGTAALVAAGDGTRGAIVLYGEEGLSGEKVVITDDVPDLQLIAARESFDGTANDFARSLQAEGVWEVCMDAGFETDCLTVEGAVGFLGERAASVSSVRYVGPAATSGHANTAPQSTQSGNTFAANGPHSQATGVEDWQPMYNVDLFGGDYREIVYERPGSSWQMCKAACEADRQCAAFTYVIPGRTEYGECFLKGELPEPSESDCCVSGIKGGPSAEGLAGSDAITRAYRR